MYSRNFEKRSADFQSRHNVEPFMWVVRYLTGLGFLLLGFLLPALAPSTLYGAEGSLYTDAGAHFSFAMPSGVQEISQDWLGKSLFDLQRLKWCKDAVEKYDKTFLYLNDNADQTTKGLVLFGVKTYKHERKRYKVFTDRIATDEFFEPEVIKNFSEETEKRLTEKGAKDVIVGAQVLNKDRKNFSFTCSYILPGEDKTKEFHWVFLGRTHIVYLDFNLYAADDMAKYQSLIEDVAGSFKFEQGFETRESYVDASVNKIGEYKLFGISFSDLGRSIIAISLIILILNLILGHFTNPRKGRYAGITEFCQRNKMWTRLATVPIGISLYLAHC